MHSSKQPDTAAWSVHAIAPEATFEAAGVADFNRDGQLDVISGETLYLGPQWVRHKVRQISPSPHPHYREDFGDLPFDVNGDGLVDVVSCSYFGKTVSWVQNSGSFARPWQEHVIDLPGPSETCRLADVDGDGDLDLLPNTVDLAVYFEYLGPREPHYVKRVVGKGGHGVGLGDINGDGRADFVTATRWFAGTDAQGWEPQPLPALGAAGIPILVADFDGDGLSDLFWGQAHGYGVSWAKQRQARVPAWTTHIIDKSFSQAHALVLADLGYGPSVITGKRIYAHEGEAGATEAPVIVSYTFDRTTYAFHRRLLYQGAPARNAPSDPRKRDAQKDFAAGSVGTGLDIIPADLDRDGDLDLVCPGKSGLYWLENPYKTTQSEAR